MELDLSTARWVILTNTYSSIATAEGQTADGAGQSHQTSRETVHVLSTEEIVGLFVFSPGSTICFFLIDLLKIELFSIKCFKNYVLGTCHVMFSNCWAVPVLVLKRIIAVVFGQEITVFLLRMEDVKKKKLNKA